MHFEAGETSIELLSIPFDDNAIEGNETATIKLLNDPSGQRYQVGSANTANVTVVDDESDPTASGWIHVNSPSATASQYTEWVFSEAQWIDGVYAPDR